MRLTKRQLKKIIREEKQKLLREGQDQESVLLDALDEFVMVLDEEMGYGVAEDELKAAVHKLVDQYFRNAAYSAQQSQEEDFVGQAAQVGPGYQGDYL